MRRKYFSLFACVLVGCWLIARVGRSQGPEASGPVEGIRAALNAIDPYLPDGEIAAEIDLFGSTSMDMLAHRWATGFKEFHPKAKVVISAEGSETIFKRLASNPSSVGMVSYPITDSDLIKLS